MYIHIQRSIRPVGQGAFYTEHFKIGSNTINVVYDCGTSTGINGDDPLTSINKEIRRTFEQGTEIEYAFISHFDDDHCNGLGFLCHHCKVKKLVIPLISELEWRLIECGPRSSAAWLLNWIESGRGPGETQIIVVRPTGVEGDNFMQPHYVDRSGVEYLSSGQPLDVGEGVLVEGALWRYVPFNFDFPKRHAALRKELQDRGFDVERILRGDAAEIISNPTKIREAIDSITGSRNTNSMCVLSIRADDVHDHFLGLDYAHCYRCGPTSSCLYMGDYEAGGKRKLTELLEWCFHAGPIGMLQIPHHGSSYSFSHDLIDWLCPELCFVSCGFQNKYHHPHGSVVRYVLQNGIPFHVVNEFPGTALYWNWALFC